MKTPWGPSQNIKDLAPGIQEVSTRSHGGYKLDRKRNAQVPEVFRQPGGWYEEDCDYAIVVLMFPDAFKEEPALAQKREDARQSLRDYYPDEYTTAFGEVIPTQDSWVLRERAALEAARGKLIVMAAWGDWNPGVPTGMVGVVARVDGKQPPDRWFLVPAGEYTKENRMCFVIDPERHKEVERF